MDNNTSGTQEVTSVEIARLREQLAAREAEITRLREQLTAREAEVKESNAVNNKLQSELTDVGKQYDKLQALNAELKKALPQANGIIDSLKRKLKDKDEQIADLRLLSSSLRENLDAKHPAERSESKVHESFALSLEDSGSGDTDTQFQNPPESEETQPDHEASLLSEKDVAHITAQIDASNLHIETLLALPAGTLASAASPMDEDACKALVEDLAQLLPPATDKCFQTKDKPEDMEAASLKEANESRRLFPAAGDASVLGGTSALDADANTAFLLRKELRKKYFWPVVRFFHRTAVAALEKAANLNDVERDPAKGKALHDLHKLIAAMMKLFGSSLYDSIISIAVDNLMRRKYTTYVKAFDAAKQLVDLSAHCVDLPHDPKALFAEKPLKDFMKAVSLENTLSKTLSSSSSDTRTSADTYTQRDRKRFRTYSNASSGGASSHSSYDRSGSPKRKPANTYGAGRRRFGDKPKQLKTAGDKPHHWYDAYPHNFHDCFYEPSGRPPCSFCAELDSDRCTALGGEYDSARGELELDKRAATVTTSPATERTARFDDTSEMDDRSIGAIIKRLVETDGDCKSKPNEESMDIQYFPSEEEGAAENSNCDKFETAEFIFHGETFQNGKPPISTPTHTQKRLVYQNRYQRCVSARARAPESASVSPIQLERSPVRISSTAVRFKSLTAHIHESDASDSSTSTQSGHTVPLLYRRYSNNCGIGRTEPSTYSDDIVAADRAGLPNKLGEVDADAISDNRIFGSLDRYEIADISGPGEESIPPTPHGRTRAEKSNSRPNVFGKRDSSCAGKAECDRRHVLDPTETYVGFDDRQERGGEADWLEQQSSLVSDRVGGPTVVGTVLADSSGCSGQHVSNTSDCGDDLRRFQLRLGWSLEPRDWSAHCARLLETGGEVAAQQYERAYIDHIHNQSVCAALAEPGVDGNNDTSSQRQCNSGGLHEQNGQQVAVDEQQSTGTAGLVPSSQNSPRGQTPAGSGERERRSAVTMDSRPFGLAAGCGDFRPAESAMGSILDRSLCVQGQQTAGQVCELVLRSGSDLDRRAGTSLGGGNTVREPTVLSVIQSASQSSQRADISRADSTGMDGSTMVAGTDRSSSGATSSSAGTVDSVHATSANRVQLLYTTKLVGRRVEDLRAMGAAAGLSTEALDDIERSWRENTSSRYEAPWRRWIEFCAAHNHDAYNPTSITLANFISERRNSGITSASVLNVECSAITSFYTVFGIGPLLPEGSATARVKRTARAELPSRRTNSVELWDPRTVLEHIVTWGADEQMDMLHLRLKLCFLLRIRLMCRSADIAGIKRTSGIQWFTDKVQIRFYRPKESGTNQYSAWQALPLTTIRGALSIGGTLREYLRRTGLLALAETDGGLLVSLKRAKDKKVHAVSADTVANMTIDVMRRAGIDVSKFTAHSARAAAASLARSSGLPIDEICSVARWKNPSTFERHYFREMPLSPSTPAQTMEEVLSSVRTVHPERVEQGSAEEHKGIPLSTAQQVDDQKTAPTDSADTRAAPRAPAAHAVRTRAPEPAPRVDSTGSVKDAQAVLPSVGDNGTRRSSRKRNQPPPEPWSVSNYEQDVV